MSKKESDKLGNRMKSFYEEIPKLKLTRRTPVIIRIDGKAFHTFTKGMKKPFDDILEQSMKETTKYLCENIQGCKLGYTQSDEISLLLTDYETLETSAWFDYEVQKMCSVSASMATNGFNKAFRKASHSQTDRMLTEWDMPTYDSKYISNLERNIEKGAMFDARCFNIPKEEVTNYFCWRQKDATRNSVQMLARSVFSESILHDKSNEEIKKMLSDKGNAWEDLSIARQHGACVIKVAFMKESRDGEMIERHKWEIDDNIPTFIGSGRDYIEKLL